MQNTQSPSARQTENAITSVCLPNMRDFLEKFGLIFTQPTSTVHPYSNSLAGHIMRTQYQENHRFSHQALSANSQSTPQPISTNNGLITEFVYNESQPALSQLLLPLLQHLGMQSRWLLWLTPQQKLSRHWISQSGLPVGKIVQVSQINAMSTVDAMEKALLTGNYSVVLGWLPDLTNSERERLRLAAVQGGAYGFIMRPTNDAISGHGHQPIAKIQSSVYH